MIRRRVLAAMTLVAALLLAGCTSSDSLAQQYRDGSEKGYIAGALLDDFAHRPDDQRGLRRQMRQAAAQRGEPPRVVEE